MRFAIFSAPAASSDGRNTPYVAFFVIPLVSPPVTVSGNYVLSCASYFSFFAGTILGIAPRQIALFAERHVPLLLLLVHGGDELPSPYCSSYRLLPRCAYLLMVVNG